MPRLAILGGSTPLPEAARWPVQQSAKNAYGLPSGPLRALPGFADCVYLPRHGAATGLAPHAINYRANVQLLADQGITHALCSYSVGAIDPALAPGSLVLPEQLIDYTWGREHSFYDGPGVQHIEFSQPFDASLSAAVIAAAKASELPLHQGGVYAVTQGPRLETAAEVARLANDGCTLVGMTAMPEIALLRERGIAASAVCLVINPAAGVQPGSIDLNAMHAAASAGAENLQTLLIGALGCFVGAAH